MIEIDSWMVEGLLDLGKTVHERVSEYNVTPRLSPSKINPVHNGEFCSSYYFPIRLLPVNSSTTNSPTIFSSDKNNLTTPTHSINPLKTRCPPKIGRKKKGLETTQLSTSIQMLLFMWNILGWKNIHWKTSSHETICLW